MHDPRGVARRTVKAVRTVLTGKMPTFDVDLEQVSQAKKAFDAIDLGPIEDADETDLVDGQRAMERLSEAVVGMSHYAGGAKEFLVAYSSFYAGTMAYAEERFDEAIGLLEEAQTTFGDALATSKAGEKHAPDWLLQEVLDLTCLAEAYRDASDHYMAATEAAKDGDADAAKTETDAALQAIRRCN